MKTPMTAFGLSVAVVVFLLMIPTQVYAQLTPVTVFEFGTANLPNNWKNATFTVDAFPIDEKYEWLVVNDSEVTTYANLPEGVGDAWDDPYLLAYDPEPRSDGWSWGFPVNKTILPGTGLTMCLQFDNNSTLTRCEFEAVAAADFKFPFPGAVLEVEFGSAAPKSP